MFEESKIWVLLTLVAIFCAFGYGAHHLSSIDEANAALLESKSKLNDMQEMLTLRRKSWSDNESVLNKIQQESDKNATLLKAKDVLDLRYSKVVSDLKYALESMKTAVEKTRGNAPGRELEEISLANGKTLRSVKLRKVEENGISLIHADGIGTIPLDLLPESLKEQYDLGPNALIPMIQEAQTALLQKSEKGDSDNLPVQASVTTPSPSPPATTAEVPPPVDDAKTKKIRLRMAEVDSRITTYASALEKYRLSAADHRLQASQAQSRGQPSSRHTENANETLAQAASIERQLAELRVERGKLAVELEYADKGK